MNLDLAGGVLFDGISRQLRDGAVVSIEGSEIKAVLDSHSPGPRQRDRLDLTGLTLLPGLIDAHTHLGAAVPFAAFAQAGSISVAELAANVFRNCELALDAGFTTCRETGGVDGGVARAVNSGLIRGPRILPSGPAIAQDGGHATFMPAFSDCFCPLAIPGLSVFTVVANGPSEVRLAARRAFRRGAHQLKLMVSGGVVSLTDDLSDTQLTIEEIRAAVDEATARHTYVTVHSHNNRAIRNAVKAGVRCVEHGTELDDETAALMAEHDVALVPTLSVIHLMAERREAWGLPREVAERLMGVEAGMTRAIGIARNAGIRIGLGSDLLGPGQNDRGLELVLRAKAGDAVDALMAATSVNADILGISTQVGTIEPGKLADVIAVKGDPVTHPEVLSDPENIVLVIKAGVIYKNRLQSRA